eukprot:Skav222142  [mRNA]  locus=scaffold1181:1095821:1106841:- [translate_table: standard]
MDATQGPEGVQASAKLLAQCKTDPFLKELEHTMLSDPQGVQTFGHVKYVREKVLDLQPNGGKVLELMDHQRNALALLQRIITCVEKEAEQWRTGMLALTKAYAEEEKARKKALEKEKKDAEKKEAQAAKAAARKAKAQKEKDEKEAKDAAAAASEVVQEAEGEDDKAKSRRRRTGAAASELEPSDPAVLRTLRVSPQLTPTVITEDLSTFVNQICTHPQLPVVLRFKKGMTKKVLAAEQQDFECFFERYLRFLQQQPPDYGLPPATAPGSAHRGAAGGGGAAPGLRCAAAAQRGGGRQGGARHRPLGCLAVQRRPAALRGLQAEAQLVKECATMGGQLMPPKAEYDKHICKN